jgi:hypothetical protein
VLQKIVACIEEKKRDEINNILMENLNQLVYDPNGICVVKF